MGFQFHGKFCSSFFFTQIPSNLKAFYSFPWAVGRIIFFLFIQTEKSFQELGSVQSCYFQLPASHYPWALSSLPTCKVKPLPLASRADSHPCPFGPFSLQVIFFLPVSYGFSPFLALSSISFLLPSHSSFFWVDYVIYIITLCFFPTFPYVFNRINSTSRWWQWWQKDVNEFSLHCLRILSGLSKMK